MSGIPASAVSSLPSPQRPSAEIGEETSILRGGGGRLGGCTRGPCFRRLLSDTSGFVGAWRCGGPWRVGGAEVAVGSLLLAPGRPRQAIPCNGEWASGWHRGGGASGALRSMRRRAGCWRCWVGALAAIGHVAYGRALHWPSAQGGLAGVTLHLERETCPRQQVARRSLLAEQRPSLALARCPRLVSSTVSLRYAACGAVRCIACLAVPPRPAHPATASARSPPSPAVRTPALPPVCSPEDFPKCASSGYNPLPIMP